MSELKEVMNVMQVSGERIPSGYYKKCEVDAVLAEKDAEIAKLDDCIRDYSEKTKTLVIANLDMQRREYHHKYKRCMAMARWCGSKVYNIRRTPLCDMNEHEYWQYENDFWQRWHKRWLELAEKFKEAK